METVTQGKSLQWYIVNAITALRAFSILTAFLVWHELRRGALGWSSFWVAATGVLLATDFVDGWLARRWEAASDFGNKLEHTLDRVALYFMVFFMVWEFIDRAPAGSLLWLFLILLVRGFLELRHLSWLAKVRRQGLLPDHNLIGQIKFWVECLAVGAAWGLMIWGPRNKFALAVLVFAWIMGAATVMGWIALSKYRAAYPV